MEDKDEDEVEDEARSVRYEVRTNEDNVSV